MQLEVTMDQLIRIGLPVSFTASGISWIEQLNPYLEAGSYIATMLVSLIVLYKFIRR